MTGNESVTLTTIAPMIYRVQERGQMWSSYL